MKNLLLVLALSALFFSCKKDNSDPPSKKFSAKLNGELFETDSVDATLTIVDSGYFRVFGVMGYVDTNNLYAGFYDNEPGLSLANHKTYISPVSDLSYDNNNPYFEYYSSPYSKLIITTVDNVHHKISGTFRGTVIKLLTSDTIHVTEGRFYNIPYTIEYH